MKYYQNQFGYFLCTNISVEDSKLENVTVIATQEEAEKLFRENNGIDDNDGVFIPSIIEQNGRIYGESLNAFLVEINTSVEYYINSYSL